MCIRDSIYIYINNIPKPPKMNSLIKIQNLNNPIRPLINLKKARTYKIAKIIVQKLKNNHLTNNCHNIKNMYELIGKLKVINIDENTFFHIILYHKHVHQHPSRRNNRHNNKQT